MLSSAIKKWIENKINLKLKHKTLLTVGGGFLWKSQEKLKKKSPFKGWSCNTGELGEKMVPKKERQFIPWKNLLNTGSICIVNPHLFFFFFFPTKYSVAKYLLNIWTFLSVCLCVSICIWSLWVNLKIASFCTGVSCRIYYCKAV